MTGGIGRNSDRNGTFVPHASSSRRSILRQADQVWDHRSIRRNDVNGLFIVAFGLLQVADGIVTFFGLKFADVDEVNPLLNNVAEVLGLGYSITLLKLAGLAFIAFLFVDRHKMKSGWITTTLGVAVSFYSWVVSNNVMLVMGAQV
jgi:hypothetical protein